MTKTCLDCDRLLPLTEFHIAKSGRLGRQSYCRDCCRDRWAAKSATMSLVRTAQRHGITLDQLAELHASGCGVCGRVDVKLDIDHDHTCCDTKSTSCGKCIRGVLCRAHNMALGHLGDNLDGVMRLVHYLRGNE